MIDDRVSADRRVLLSLLKQKQEAIQQLIKSKANLSDVTPLFREFRYIQKEVLKTFPFLVNNDSDGEKPGD